MDLGYVDLRQFLRFIRIPAPSSSMTGADSDSEKQTQKEPAEASLASQTNDGSSAQLHATGEQTATAVSARSIAPSSQPIQPESQLPVSTSTEEALRPSIGE